ncbi:MAG: hypothetical protein ACRBFS_26235 [Aureispira sp.]
MKTISFLSLVLILSFVISCTKEAPISTATEVTEPTSTAVSKNNTPSKISLTDNYGFHSFDVSNLEQGNYDLTQGSMTVNGRSYPTNIKLSNRYLASMCVEQDVNTPNQFSIGGINQSSDVASLSVTAAGQNAVEVEYELNGNTTILQVTGAVSTAALLSMTDIGDCTATGNQRWIPVAMALIAVIGTVSCAVANSNSSSDCAAVAANCANGVASYEYEGGLCGNGDCDVTCN